MLHHRNVDAFECLVTDWRRPSSDPSQVRLKIGSGFLNLVYSPYMRGAPTKLVTLVRGQKGPAPPSGREMSIKLLFYFHNYTNK
jgi:hypothetical protein